MAEYTGWMTAYRLFWLLKTDVPLYLVTDLEKESCTVRMTASKPKKVSRTIDLDLNPDQTFLLREGKDGGILWTRPVSFSRDAAGKLWVDITDLLREMDVPFTFCEQGTLRHYKARPRELSRTMHFFSWGWKDAWDGFSLESTAGATLSFFPKSCYICGAEIRHIRLSGFYWSSQKLDRHVQSMEVPCHVDQQTACRCLEEQGSLAALEISSDRVRMIAHMFFLSSFRVEGFGRNWEYRLHNDMFQENHCAPCKTDRFGPLFCKLLEAADEAAVEKTLQWAVEANILKE